MLPWKSVLPEAKAIRCSVLVRLWDTSVYQIMIIKNNKWSIFAQ